MCLNLWRKYNLVVSSKISTSKITVLGSCAILIIYWIVLDFFGTKNNNLLDEGLNHQHLSSARSFEFIFCFASPPDNSGRGPRRILHVGNEISKFSQHEKGFSIESGFRMDFAKLHLTDDLNGIDVIQPAPPPLPPLSSSIEQPLLLDGAAVSAVTTHKAPFYPFESGLLSDGLLSDGLSSDGLLPVQIMSGICELESCENEITENFPVTESLVMDTDVIEVITLHHPQQQIQQQQLQEFIPPPHHHHPIAPAMPETSEKQLRNHADFYINVGGSFDILTNAIKSAFKNRKESGGGGLFHNIFKNSEHPITVKEHPTNKHLPPPPPPHQQQQQPVLQETSQQILLPPVQMVEMIDIQGPDIITACDIPDPCSSSSSSRSTIDNFHQSANCFDNSIQNNLPCPLTNGILLPISSSSSGDDDTGSGFADNKWNNGDNMGLLHWPLQSNEQFQAFQAFPSNNLPTNHGNFESRNKKKPLLVNRLKRLAQLLPYI